MLYARTTDDQEDVANIITKYGLIALPIVDHENCMVGIVTVDDAMQVLQDETTEDISIMAGVNPNEDSYFGTSIIRACKEPYSLAVVSDAVCDGNTDDHEQLRECTGTDAAACRICSDAYRNRRKLWIAELDTCDPRTCCRRD